MTTEAAGVETEPTTEGAPYVVLEHLVVGGIEMCRVVCTTQDQMEAHSVSRSLADAGLRIWLVDLWSEDGTPTVERYVGKAGAVWLHERGFDPSGRGAGDKLTEAGR